MDLVGADTVFSAMLRLGNQSLVAKELRIRPQRLVQRFNSELDQAKRVLKNEKSERIRASVLAEYRNCALRIGRNPNSSDLINTALGRQISRVFGSYASFWEVLGSGPDYVRSRVRKSRR